MSCSDVIGTVGKYFKTFVVATCCLIVIGAVLLIVGGVFFSKNNGRSAFKKAVKDFDPTPIYAWTGNINGVPVTVKRESLNVRGESGAASVFAEVVVPAPKAPSSILPVDVRINTVTPFVRDAYFMISRSSTRECSSSFCANGKDCHCKRDIKKFREECAASGGIDVADPGWCKADSYCAECLLNLYLKELYIVAEEISRGQYREDRALRSAMYSFGPFDNDYQTDVPTHVTVRLYSDKDPYITLQRETKGKNDFGVDYPTIGIVLLVFGAIFFLLGLVVCGMLICHCCR